MVRINIPSGGALRAECLRRWQAGEGFALATLNLDHLVKLSRDAEFARAYAGQDLVVADGRPVVALARLAGRPVDLLPGSDLVVPLARLATEAGQRVALVGATAPVLETAAETLRARVPGLDLGFCHAPEFGFDPDGAAAEAILRRLDAEGIGLCFLALGAPKQERLARRGRALAPRCGFASVGAGLDFLGGGQRRAPRWMRRIGLEWLWRMGTDPLRLAPRYAACAAILPGLAIQAWRLRRDAPKPPGTG